MTRALPHHAEATCDVDAAAADVFRDVDRPERIAGHMARRSWRMGGATMGIDTDPDAGQAVGSRIRLAGRVLGMDLHADCVVRERDPPRRKAWETIGEPRLLVVGPYRITVTIDAFDIDRSGSDSRANAADSTANRDRSRVRIAIDYARPAGGASRVLGMLFGATYARWCVDQMSGDLVRHFADHANATKTVPVPAADRSKGNPQ